jgi:hypothetical protein
MTERGNGVTLKEFHCIDAGFFGLVIVESGQPQLEAR